MLRHCAPLLTALTAVVGLTWPLPFASVELAAAEPWHDGLELIGNGSRDYHPRFTAGGVADWPDGRWTVQLDPGTTIQLPVANGQLGESLWFHQQGRVQNTRPLRWIITIADDGTLVGQLRTTGERWAYSLRGTVASDGSVSGVWEYRKQHDSADADRSGPLQAELTAWADVAAAESPITGEGWPGYGGPSGNFISQPQGHDLVDDIRHMRPMWRSEAVLPSAIGSVSRTATNLNCRKQPLAGGSSTPILVDGKLYMMTFHPGVIESNRIAMYTDPVHDDGSSVFEQYHNTWGSTFGARAEAIERQRWSVDAVDTLYCIDARSGQTLWTTPVPGGANAQDHKGGFNNFTPCYIDGVVIAQGSTRRLMGFDASSGDLLWQTPPSSSLEAALATSVANRTTNKPFFATSRWGHEAPIIVDGQVIVARAGLESRDPYSGSLLWRVGNIVDRVPAVWHHQGANYLIAWNGSRDTMRCIDLDGNEIWAADSLLEANLASHLVGIDGDTFALLEGNQNAEQTVLVIGRLTLNGPEVRHRVTRNGANSNFMPPVIHNGRVIAAWNNGTMIVDTTSGEVVAESDSMATSLNGHIQAMEQHYLILGDNHHGINDYHWTDQQLSPGPNLKPPHYTTSPYTSSPWNQVYADGRLFIRGSDGIYAYDLRDPAATAGNHTPHVQFTLSDLVRQAPLQVTADASASSDDDGDDLVISWDFGDGTTADGTTATHTFTTPGRYRVRCTATDSKGLAAHQWAWVNVADPDSNQAPRVRLNAEPMSGTAPFTVQLSAAGTVDVNGDDLTYTWLLPDGTSVTGADASAAITTTGRATVTLRVADARGAISERSLVLTANPPTQGATLWHETFADVAAGSQADDGDTAWQATGVGRVVDGGFEASDADHGSVWTSAPIDISSLTAPAFEVVLATPNANQLESSDSASVAYLLDDGEAVITHRFAGPIAGGADYPIHALVTPGASLRIQVTLQNSSGSEVHRIQSVRVYNTHAAD